MITKVRLNQVCEIQAGGTPSRARLEFWDNGNIPWVKISDLKSKFVSETEEFITEKGLNNSSTKLFKKGTLLYTIFATLGETAILDIDATTNQAIAGISITSDKLILDYLYHYFLSIKEDIKIIGRGVAQNNINLSILRNLEILLPSIERQNEVAYNLNYITKLIVSRKTQLEKLDLLVKSRFIEMFGEPGKDEKDWGLTTLEECCEINPKRPRDISDELMVSFVPMTAVSVCGKIDCSDIRLYKEVKKGFTYFAENDVLFAKITPCMENGKGGIARGLKGGIASGSTEFHVLRPIPGKTNPYWLYTLTMLNSFRIGARKVMAGTGGQLRVPINYLEEYSITLPPIDLQNQFTVFVQQIDKSKFEVKQSLEKLETLKKSLMQEYFGSES